jgi:hypothetical protein
MSKPIKQRVDCTNYFSCFKYHGSTFKIVCKEKKCNMYMANKPKLKKATHANPRIS